MESFRDHILFLNKVALKLRIDLLEILHKAESGHLGGSLSALDLMVALYFGQIATGPVMKYDVSKPGWEGQDYFVLSKGHASPAWYVLLASLGFFDENELKYFRQVNSLLQAFPSKKIPGVAISAGGPGYGLAAAVGLAISLKADKQPNRVFVLVGDGELQEGQVWEAAMAAAHYKLDNLTLLVDYNGLQMDGQVRGVMSIDPITDKFQGFGWKTVPVNNGHDYEELLSGLDRALETQRRPTVVIARTIKGKGVLFAENKVFYHAEVLSSQEMAEALPKLKAQLVSLISGE